MSNAINKSYESLTVGNIKVLSPSYSKNELIQSKVLIQALKLARNSYSDIVEMSSDSIITPAEKIQLSIISNDTDNEYAILLSQYTDYGLTGNAAWTAHVATYTPLSALLSLILSDMSTSHPIEGTSLSTLFGAYYATRKTAEDTLSTYLQLTIAKVSQFGIKTNVSNFAGTEQNGSLYPFGFDGLGEPKDTAGNIYYLGARISITAAVHVTGFTTKKCFLYVPVAGGAIGSCYYHAGDNQFKTSADVQVNEVTNILIGEFNITSGTIGTCIVYNTAKPFDDMRDNRFMELLQYASSSTDFANMLVNMSIQYFNYLAVNKLWSNEILTSKILVGLGLGTAGSGFRFRAQCDNQDELETAVFDVYYDDEVIFKIYPASGDIDFGDFAQGGLRWKHSTKTIRSKDDKLVIGTDGKLTATDITANSGTWKGDLATGFLENLAAYTFLIAATDIQSDIFAEFNAVYSKIRGNLSSGTLNYLGVPSFTKYDVAVNGTYSENPIEIRGDTTYTLTGITLTGFIYNDSTTTWDLKSVLPAIGAYHWDPVTHETVLFSGTRWVMIINDYGGFEDHVMFGFAYTPGGTFTDGAWQYAFTSTVVLNKVFFYSAFYHSTMIVGDAGFVSYKNYGPLRYGYSTPDVTETVGTNNWYGGCGLYKYFSALHAHRMLIVGASGNIAYSNGIADLSPNAITWVTDTVGTANWREAAWSEPDDMVLIAGDSGAMAYSYDKCANWSQYTFPSSYALTSLICTEEGRFYGEANGNIWHSDNGLDWEEETFAGGSLKGIAISNGGSTPYHVAALDSVAVLTAADVYIASEQFANQTITSIQRSTVDHDTLGDTLKLTFGTAGADVFAYIRDNALECKYTLSAIVPEKVNVLKSLMLDPGIEVEEL